MTKKEPSSILSQFGRDFGFYSIAGAIPSFLGIAALIAFTHIYDANAYGKYALAMVFVSVISTGLFDWLRQAVLRYDSDDAEIVPTTTAVLLGLILAVLTLGLVGFVVFRSRLGVYEPYYLAALSAIIGIGTFKVFSAIFQARIQPKAVMKYKVIRGFIRHGLGFFLSIYLFGSIIGWIWGVVLGSALVVVLMILELDIRSIEWDSVIANRLAKYGIPMMGWLFGFTLLTFIDRVLIETLQGTTAVGVYTANYTLVQTGLPLVLVPVIEAVHPVIMNEWNGENGNAISALISKYSRYFLLLGVPATIFSGIISQPLSHLALGSEYHPGFVIIPMIAVALFLWNFAMIGHKGLEVQDATGLMTLGVSLAVTVNIGLNYLLIPLYGYIGAAAATLASSATYAIFAYVMSLRTVRWTTSTSTIFRVGICSAAMTGIGSIGYLLPEAPILAPILSAIGASITYLVLIVLVGEMKDEEMIQIKSVLRSFQSYVGQ